MSKLHFALPFLLLALSVASSEIFAADPVGAMSPGDKFKAVANERKPGEIVVYTYPDNRETWKLTLIKADVTVLTFSGDGKLLLAGSKDKTLLIIDAQTGKTKHQLKGHEGGIVKAEFSSDNKTITSMDEKRETIKWTTATGKIIPDKP